MIYKNNNASIELCSFEEWLPNIKEQPDFVCIDPPYGVLGDHEIESAFDKKLLFNLLFEKQKDNSFLAMFGQMPTIFDFHAAALNAGYEFVEDITWVKRVVSAVYLPIIRQKEDIYIYRKGRAKFFETKGDYLDIKMPAYLDGLYNIKSLYAYISDLESKFKNGRERDSFSIDKPRKKNDPIYEKMVAGKRDSCPQKVNFTDVWSFMPENRTSFGENGTNILHPTVKPTKLLIRLIELCCPKNGLVLDCFLGSGSTAVAAKLTNRKFSAVKYWKNILTQPLKG